jgi:hypothetical protein
MKAVMTDEAKHLFPRREPDVQREIDRLTELRDALTEEIDYLQELLEVSRKRRRGVDFLTAL